MINFFEALIEFLIQLIHHKRRPRASKQGAAISSTPEEGFSLGRIVRSPYQAIQAENEPTELIIPSSMLLRHLVMLGASGQGKTNLLIQIVRWLISKRSAVCLIDARGDLVVKVLVHLAHDSTPEELAERIVLYDFRTDAYSLPTNILREPGLDPYTRVALILEVLEGMWELGVQTLQCLRACLLTLALTTEDYSLLEVEPLLTNAAFRKQVLVPITDITLMRFWERYEALSDLQKSQWIEPCLNRLSTFLSRPVLRNAFGQRTALSLRQLLDDRPDRIILVALAADTMYADAAIAGNLIVTQILSGMMRTDRPESARQPMHLLIDEFENFSGAGKQFQEAIQEGRRFKLGLCLSHQSSVQVEPKLRALIKNVVGTQIFFGVGGGEADVLAGEIASDEPKALIRRLLMNQQVGECVCVQRGRPAHVRIKTRHCPDPDVTQDKIEIIRTAAFTRFGKGKGEIEHDIALRTADLCVAGSNSKPNASPNRTTVRTKGKAPVSIEVRESND